MAESEPVTHHRIVIPVPIFLVQSGSQHVILGHPWATYAQQCQNNTDDGSCEITKSAIDGSEQVTIVATFPGDKSDRFASSSGNVYA